MRAPRGAGVSKFYYEYIRSLRVVSRAVRIKERFGEVDALKLVGVSWPCLLAQGFQQDGNGNSHAENESNRRETQHETEATMWFQS